MSVEQPGTHSPMCEPPPVTYVSGSNPRALNATLCAITNIAQFKISRVSCALTASDTSQCETRGCGVAISTASTRARVAVVLGRRAGRRGAKAWAFSTRSAPAEGAACGTASMPRHAEGGEGRSPAPDREARGGTGAKLARGLRARTVSSGSLLHSERPRAHDRRGGERAGSGLWPQGDRRALCARREPGISPRRPRACRSLPRPRSAHAARGPERDCVCFAQRAPPPGQARSHASPNRVHGSGVVWAVVLGLAQGNAPVPRSARCRSASHLAYQRGLA